MDEIKICDQAGDDVWFKEDLNTTEMKMLRMMLSVTMKDKLRNEEDK